MEFVLLFHSPPDELSIARDDPAAADHWESWRSYMGAIYEAGIVRSGNALQSHDTATTVRVRDGKRHVLDGPFADTKEVLGGYLVIDVPSLDDAIAWALRSPSCRRGSTEVRPVLDMG